MWFEIIVQGIGFIAIAMNIISVQFNKHWSIMLFKSLGSLFFAVQYLLMGAYVGMVMDIIGVIRNFVFAYNVKKNKSNKWWIALFSVITVAVGVTTIILTWDKMINAVSHLSSDPKVLTAIAVFISVLSILAKFISTIGYGAKDPHVIRMINLPTFSMWIIYNAMVLSIAAIISDSMSIVSIIIAEIRFKGLKKKGSRHDKHAKEPTNFTNN
jgi:hypothetical protein